MTFPHKRMGTHFIVFWAVMSCILLVLEECTASIFRVQVIEEGRMVGYRSGGIIRP
jgi:hypothetical protein